MRSHLGIVCTCLALYGCGTAVNPYNPNANYESDYYSCQMEAAGAFPVQMQTSTTPSVTNTNCNVYGSTADCTSTTSPGKSYNSGGDTNLGNRLTATFRCMDAKGWRTQSASNPTSNSDAYPRTSSNDEERARINAQTNEDIEKGSRVGQSCTAPTDCGFGELCVKRTETSGVCEK